MKTLMAQSRVKKNLFFFLIIVHFETETEVRETQEKTLGI